MSVRPRIGITLGDVAGIGPEIVTKALASRKLDKRFEYEIIGDVHTKHRRDAADWIVEGARRCLRGELAALVTAPVSKELVAPWPGQTELLAHIAKTRRFAMMLVGGPLRVSLVTIHEPLRRVPSKITRRRIREVIVLTRDFCRRIGIRRPRIAVTGLNPHAGEGGLIGDEERRIIAPAIKGTGATGPWPADTLFHKAYHGAFDAVVAMYHDQGLAPLKMIAFDTGVNLTLGLPFVRTSPDHGTAPDIAGKGIARPDSMIAAINLAARLAASTRKSRV
ncbi:MAG TPA: 4-hydroxythreonine-4-phosphate dehydrogenase PdxA [Verrucomicrobiae bacterium]|nr:4-hydroxythreonine-4-phosphate dehydrogenase PdxA [Verrucomicrobiae bacterium]